MKNIFLLIKVALYVFLMLFCTCPAPPPRKMLRFWRIGSLAEAGAFLVAVEDVHAIQHGSASFDGLARFQHGVEFSRLSLSTHQINYTRIHIVRVIVVALSVIVPAIGRADKSHVYIIYTYIIYI